jgi:monoamine oxidase
VPDVNEADVVVLGAGAAGLAAAHDLSRAGRRVLVLEARQRVGGRIHTIHDDGWPVPVELGAEFVHGRPDATWRMLRDAGLPACDVAENHWHLRRGRLRPAGDFWERIGKVMRGLRRLRRDVTFAEYLRRIRNPRLRDEKDLAAMFVEGFDAAHLERISAKSLAAEQEQVGEDATQFRLPGGYDGVLRHMMTTGNLDRSVRLDTLVTRVRWSRGEVEAIDQRGARFTARRAVVTLPVALLQPDARGRGAVRFEPEITRTRAAAAMLGTGPVVKVILRFREPFWEDSKLRDMSFVHWRDGALPTWWTTLPLRTAVLTGWAGGPKADALSGRGDAHAFDQAVRTLATIARLSRRRIESLVEDRRACDWQSDPLARGAYSYVRVGGGKARAELARPVAGTLFFAGEATDTNGKAGTVAGAIASGRRAAREVLRAPEHRVTTPRARSSSSSAA